MMEAWRKYNKEGKILEYKNTIGSHDTYNYLDDGSYKIKETFSRGVINRFINKYGDMVSVNNLDCNGNLVFTQENKYEDGKLIKSIITNKNGNTIKEYSYDDIGRLIVERIDNYAKNICIINKYYKDDTNLPTTIEHYDGIDIYVEKIEYDENNKPIKYYVDDKIKCIVTFNDKGLEIKKEDFYPNSDIIDTREIYYDDNSNVTKITFKTNDKHLKITETIETFEYNDNNLLIKEYLGNRYIAYEYTDFGKVNNIKVFEQDTNKLILEIEYVYNDKNLIIETIRDGKYEGIFEYNDNGKIIYIKTEREDDLYCETSDDIFNIYI